MTEVNNMIIIKFIIEAINLVENIYETPWFCAKKYIG